MDLLKNCVYISVFFYNCLLLRNKLNKLSVLCSEVDRSPVATCDNLKFHKVCLTVYKIYYNKLIER